MSNNSGSILRDGAVPAAQAQRKVYSRPAFTRIGIDRTELGLPDNVVDWSDDLGQFEKGKTS